MLEVDIKGRTFKAADGSTLHAVGQLKFSLAAASFTCIVGPSGCGKTTTLRMVLGLDPEFAGHVRLNGEGVVAAVFQEPRLLPWRTVEQNVRLAMPAEQAQLNLDDLFTELGLSDMRNFYPGELSLGLARRAALARAFALQPQLLVLDEPFVSLDDMTAERLRKLLMKLWHAHPTTALMVTHNIHEAALLADRIIVFSSRPAQIVESIKIEQPQAERRATDIDAVVQRLRRVIQQNSEE